MRADMNELFTKFQTEVNQLKLKCSYCELLRSEKAQKKKKQQPSQPIKICQQFLWLFLRPSGCLTSTQARQTTKSIQKKKKKTNINR